jgi:acyl carrier protein
MSLMMDARIDQGLRKIFADVFGADLPPLTPHTTAADVPGWDSIRMMSLVIGIQDHFDITLRARDVEPLENVGDMAAMVKAKLEQAGRRLA